jgi:hypothetical protein
MMELWEMVIKPTLYDYSGQAIVCSNPAEKNLVRFTEHPYASGCSAMSRARATIDVRS